MTFYAAIDLTPTQQKIEKFRLQILAKNLQRFSIPTYSFKIGETSSYTQNKLFAGLSLPAKTKALRTNGQTDRRTDQSTDTPSFRVVAHD